MCGRWRTINIRSRENNKAEEKIIEKERKRERPKTREHETGKEVIDCKEYLKKSLQVVCTNPMCLNITHAR